MSIFGGGSSSPTPAVPQYTSLQIQTSSSALPVPIVWGTFRIAPNVIWTGGFKATPVYTTSGSSGFLGIGNSKTTYISGYTYSVQLIFALCEGPLSDVTKLYQNSKVKPPSAHYLATELGGRDNYAPSFVPAAQQLTYAGTALAHSSYFDLGTGATTGTINFEVVRLGAGFASGINGADADPARVVVDLLCNETYGVGFPRAALDLTTILGTSGDASYQSYCAAVGLALSPALVNSETANSILARWLQVTNAAAVWSGGRLKIIPYGDTALAAGTVSAQITTAVPPPTKTPSGPQNATVQVDAAAGFLADGGVVYSATGTAFTKVNAFGPPNTNKGRYTVTASGLYTFAPLDKGEVVVISYTYTSAGAYTPFTEAVYDLTDDDLVGDASRDPIVVTRTDPYTVVNIQPVEYSDRNNAYAATPVEARAQHAIEAYGVQRGSAVTAHEICSVAMACRVAQLVLQRGLAIRNTYAFRLSWEFGLLEPMDIVTLTDAGLGLQRQKVRITAIEEDADGLLAVTAEEFVPGAATQVDYATSGATGTAPSQDDDPARVHPPAIFESPSQMTGGNIVLVFGVSGGTSGVADPNWGGCKIHVSYDGGSSYSPVAALTGASYQGTLTASLAAYAGANPDTVDTIAVDVTQSGAALDAGSVADAKALRSLVVVDNEIMAYGSAALTGASTYALTYLQRGLNGASASAHPAGAPFLALAGPLANIVVDPSRIGATLYFKFQSINVFGNAPEDLSDCVAYPKFIYGSGWFGAVAQLLARGTSLDFGLASALPTQADDYGFASDPYTRVIDLGIASA